MDLEKRRKRRKVGILIGQGIGILTEEEVVVQVEDLHQAEDDVQDQEVLVLLVLIGAIGTVVVVEAVLAEIVNITSQTAPSLPENLLL